MEFQIVVFVLLICKAQSQSPVATLYTENDSQGQTVDITNNCANLNDFQFDNLAKSICVTGLWLLYGDADFNPNGYGSIEIVFGSDKTCTNLVSLENPVSSLRFAGNPTDFTLDSFTIYENSQFQGPQEFIEDSKDMLSNVVKQGSIIVTGESDWTLFQEANYTGSSLCLKFPSTPEKIPAFMDDLSMNYRSVMKGCDSTIVYPLTSFPFDPLY